MKCIVGHKGWTIAIAIVVSCLASTKPTVLGDYSVEAVLKTKWLNTDHGVPSDTLKPTNGADDKFSTWMLSILFNFIVLSSI